MTSGLSGNWTFRHRNPFVASVISCELFPARQQPLPVSEISHGLQRRVHKMSMSTAEHTNGQNIQRCTENTVWDRICKRPQFRRRNFRCGTAFRPPVSKCHEPSHAERLEIVRSLQQWAPTMGTIFEISKGGQRLRATVSQLPTQSLAPIVDWNRGEALICRCF